MVDNPESTTDANKIKDFFQMTEKVKRLNKRKANQTETDEPVVNVQELEVLNRRGATPKARGFYRLPDGRAFKRGLKNPALPKEYIKKKGESAKNRYENDPLFSLFPKKPKPTKTEKDPI